MDLWLERGDRREKMRERNMLWEGKSSWLPLVYAPTGNEPATRVCALIGNQTGNLSICRWHPRLSLIRQSTWNPLKSLVSSCKAITTFWLLSQKISFELTTSRHLKQVLLWSVTHLFTLLHSVAQMDPIGVKHSFVQVYCYFLIYFNVHCRQWGCFLFC